MRSEQDDIFDLLIAASRNPNEQNRRETLMANLLNQDARKIMKKAYATRRERLQRERGEFKNWRDAISWNKQDAGYWRRLNAFQQMQTSQINKEKGATVRERKNEIDEQDRKNAKDLLERREVIKVLKKHLQLKREQERVKQWRLKSFIGFI